MTSSIASNTLSNLSINPPIQKAASSSTTTKQSNNRTAILNSVSHMLNKTWVKNTHFLNTTSGKLGPGKYFFTSLPKNPMAEESKKESVDSKPEGSFIAPAITPNLSRQNSGVSGGFNKTDSSKVYS
jgi:hypothetical protein